MLDLNGRAYHQLDEKNRVRIPSKFFPPRADGTELDEKDDRSGVQYTLMVGTEECISVYLKEDLMEKMLPLRTSAASASAARALRKIRGSMEDVVTDKQGRVVVPQSLRDAAGLSKDLVSIGMGDHFEIWAKEHLAAEDEKMSFATAFEELGIFF